MNFQDSLKARFRTIEEAADRKRIEREKLASQNAQIVLDDIKAHLIISAENGEYTEMPNGRKKVFFILPLPEEMQYYLQLEKNVTTIPAVPTLLERQLDEMAGKSRKECRRIANRYRSMDLSSGGKPEEHHCNYRFSIKEERKEEFDWFFSRLSEFASADGIDVEICIFDSFHNNAHSLPVEIIDEWRDKSHYKLAAKSSSIIPESFSTDVPIMVNSDSVDSRGEAISIDNMEGHLFEDFCADLLRKNGFIDVYVTKGSGDQGIDIIAHKDGVKYGIQCKCYASDIGNSAVQEAFSGKSFYKCHVGVVLTNRYFTRSAKQLAESNGILLWDRAYLQNLMSGCISSDRKTK